MSNPTLSAAEAARELEAGRTRLAALSERRRITEQNRNETVQSLEKAQQEARTAFGTDDVEVLKDMLAERTAQNSAAVLAFKASLDAVQAELARIDSASAA